MTVPGMSTTPEMAAWSAHQQANPGSTFANFHSAWLQAHPDAAAPASALTNFGQTGGAAPPAQAGADTPGAGNYGQTGGEYNWNSLLHPTVPVAPPAPSAPGTPAPVSGGIGGTDRNGGGQGGSAGDTSQGDRGSVSPETAKAMGEWARSLSFAGSLVTGNLPGIAVSLANPDLRASLKSAYDAVRGYFSSEPDKGNSPGPSGSNGGISGAGVGSGEIGADTSVGGTQGGPAGVGSSPGGDTNGNGSGGSGSGGAGDQGGASAGSGGDGEGCFVGETPILMGDGSSKAICEVVVGDMVMAFHRMGPLEPRRVVSTMVYPKRHVMAVASIITTAHHPFLVASGDFVHAMHLRAGDLIVKADGEPYVIGSIERDEGTATVFNIEVDDLHTYVAGGFRVHNKYASGGIVGGNLGMMPAKGGHRAGQVSGRSFQRIADGIRAYGMGFASGGKTESRLPPEERKHIPWTPDYAPLRYDDTPYQTPIAGTWGDQSLMNDDATRARFGNYIREHRVDPEGIEHGLRSGLVDPRMYANGGVIAGTNIRDLGVPEDQVRGHERATGERGRDPSSAADFERAWNEQRARQAERDRQDGLSFAAGGFATANTHGVGANRSIPRGLIGGNSPGRADAVHASVPKGGYVVPADVVSSLGQGNTMNGSAKLDRWESGSGMPGTGYARGGLVPVRLSGGEHYLSPHFIQWLGKGDANKGAEIMDGHVKRIRSKAITHLRNLPPPK